MNNKEKADLIAQEMVANLNYNVLKEAAEQEKHDLISLLFKALTFSAEKHTKQRRKDIEESPYINHPIALANILAQRWVIDENVLCAAILHDTLEDTETTANELRKHFGEKITSIVLEVSDDKSLDKEVRKQMQIEHAASISHEAKLVKLADKIANITDIINTPPAKWTKERKQDYFAWAKAVVNNLRGVHQGLEKDFDDLLKTKIS
jgi:GTP diphosphokinase / guanosine-3',5'-bis(diphosphate) 3'-diphosphatase